MGVTVEQLAADRQRRDAPLWNYTVLGDAAAKVSNELKDKFPGLPGSSHHGCENRIVHGYWSIDLEILHTTAPEQLPSFLKGAAASFGGYLGLTMAVAEVLRMTKWHAGPLAWRESVDLCC